MGTSVYASVEAGFLDSRDAFLDRLQISEPRVVIVDETQVLSLETQNALRSGRWYDAVVAALGGSIPPDAAHHAAVLELMRRSSKPLSGIKWSNKPPYGDFSGSE